MLRHLPRKHEATETRPLRFGNPSSSGGRRLMTQRKIIILDFTLGAAALVMGWLFASAQTLWSYGCTDGSKFIVGFYAYDKRAHIDGRAVTLASASRCPASLYELRCHVED